jgi:signal transduction histidine kinase
MATAVCSIGVAARSGVDCVEGIFGNDRAWGGHQLLRFARPEQMTMAPVELRAVIMRAIEDVPGAAAAVELEGNFATINGDDVLLRRAFSNLVRNSLEACADAGMPARVYVRSDITPQGVQMVFEDNGPGFSPEYLAKAFQPFATTKANGTGLGLAIVQKVIVSHNGHITATNRPEGGAQFRLRLPLPPRDVGPITPIIRAVYNDALLQDPPFARTSTACSAIRWLPSGSERRLDQER